MCRVEKAYVEKIIFIYIFLLAFMAVYMRGQDYSYVPPRYALFALMALTSVYCLFIKYISTINSRWFQQSIPLIFVCAFMLWLCNFYRGTDALAVNRADRGNAAQRYLMMGDKSALSMLVWDVEYGDIELKRAEIRGVYNISKFEYKEF